MSASEPTEANEQGSMLGRSCDWPAPMLRRLQALYDQSLRDIHAQLQVEFNGLPRYLEEVAAELRFMNGRGPDPRQWNPAMESRLMEYYARGMDVNDVTNELFNEFAKPESGYWQEVYRKMQVMKLLGQL